MLPGSCSFPISFSLPSLFESHSMHQLVATKNWRGCLCIFLEFFCANLFPLLCCALQTPVPLSLSELCLCLLDWIGVPCSVWILSPVAESRGSLQAGSQSDHKTPLHLFPFFQTLQTFTACCSMSENSWFIYFVQFSHYLWCIMTWSRHLPISSFEKILHFAFYT